MHIEQLEVQNRLQRYIPFNELPAEDLAHLAQSVEIAYYKAGSLILEFNAPIQDLGVVRSGAVEIYRRDGSLYDRLSEGGVFGQWGLLLGRKVRFPVKAIEDTLIYFIPADLFDELFARHEAFAVYMELEDQARLRKVVAHQRDMNGLMTSTVEQLISRPPVTVAQTATIQQAAAVMSQANVSALLLTDETTGKVVGIVTDADLRSRCLAAGVSAQSAVSTVMSQQLIYIDPTTYIFEAMLLMLRHQVQHLPILAKQQPLGVIALSDIVRYESHNSLFVVSNIFQRQRIEELAALSLEVRQSFIRLVRQDANSRIIGSAMSAIGRAFIQRLLEFAENRFGKPPIPYCFIVLGSMARDEQLIVTDQDNALILDNSYDPEQHGAYFQQLAQFVSDHLAELGYPYCTGGIMASNEQWRQPLHQWQSRFQTWIREPTPEFLLHSSIFFDIAGVWGETQWVDGLKQLISSMASQDKRFLAAMAHNAVQRTPPLGFFKQFVLEKDGQHQHTINLKRRGTAPLTDLIRVHALAVGSQAQNSFERLQAIDEAKRLNPGVAADLRDALEFMAMVRIRHQALALSAGQAPSNFVDPNQLSPFERRSLKDAFQVLSQAQDFLKYRYHPNRID